ncbi:ycgL [Symbiodinium pilosum]|uniref:YcgL protein n=1 Tax=Symbiodinium pilosum TaxID=2952 RepID=A0A812WN81_SYMPI|nr:ycgL [Symbiodinium pilosum]
MGTVHASSDYDIKCIFVQPRSSYFGLKSSATTFKHNFAGAAGGSDVEISGWEARHALQLLSEDNPTVLGLLLSPVVFVGEEWRVRLQDAVQKHSNRQRLMYHWYSHARRNYQSYILNSESPQRKSTLAPEQP